MSQILKDADNQRLPKSFPPALAGRVQYWDDERGIGNSLIVTLTPGWRFGTTECHVQGEDTIRAAIKAVRDAEPCDCVGCKKDGAK